jgi:hypothetical protein
MCLLGLKPCVIIDHGNWDEAQYGEETYAKKHCDAVVRRGPGRVPLFSRSCQRGQTVNEMIMI